MRKEYKVFDKGFNKVLDLIEETKCQSVDAYKCLIETLPNEIVAQLSECDEFDESNQFYTADLVNCGNTLHFDFARNYNYLRTMLKVHRIYEKEVEENDSIELFEIVIRNSFQKSNNKGDFEYKCNIYLERKGFEYYLVSKEKFKTEENVTRIPQNKTYTSKVLVDYSIIEMCFETEEEYSPDLEIEFEGDFEV